nr:hypothetical protein [Candidatus Sigynarchaeota archaeon]
MVLEWMDNYPNCVQTVKFDDFWARSRFNGIIHGLDLEDQVRQSFSEMELGGGFVSFLAYRFGNKTIGSLAVFKDPWYRSAGRETVACFGLVTALDADTLARLVEAARDIAEKAGCTALRGPVNVPRILFGYGIQVSGFGLPVIAGTSFNTRNDAYAFFELESDDYFDHTDKYYNFSQDFGKTRAYIDAIKLDRSFRVVNPDLDNPGDIAGRVADMMNHLLVYRPDYQLATAVRLVTAAKAYKLVPHGEKLLAFYFDGDVLAGGVIMQPDWFQVFAGARVTGVIGEIYMLEPAYQGRKLMLNFAEYSEQVLKDLVATHYEHASIWAESDKALSTVKVGYNAIIKEFRVYEVIIR